MSKRCYATELISQTLTMEQFTLLKSKTKLVFATTKCQRHYKNSNNRKLKLLFNVP